MRTPAISRSRNEEDSDDARPDHDAELPDDGTRGGGLSSARTRQASIEFDTSAGQSETYTGPADFLASAFAACVLNSADDPNVKRLAPWHGKRRTDG